MDGGSTYSYSLYTPPTTEWLYNGWYDSFTVHPIPYAHMHTCTHARTHARGLAPSSCVLDAPPPPQVWRTLKLRSASALSLLMDPGVASSIKGHFRGLDVTYAAATSEAERGVLLRCLRTPSAGGLAHVNHMIREGMQASLNRELLKVNHVMGGGCGHPSIESC